MFKLVLRHLMSKELSKIQYPSPGFMNGNPNRKAGFRKKCDNVYEIKQRPLSCLFTVTDVLDTVLALVCPCPPWSRAPLSQ